MEGLELAHVIVKDGRPVCSECGMPFLMTGARYCPMCGARLRDLLTTVTDSAGNELGVKIVTEEQIHKSEEALTEGVKTFHVPKIRTANREDDST